MQIRRYYVLNTPVDGVTMREALQYVEDTVKNGSAGPQTVLAVNPEKVFVLRQDAFLLDFFNHAGLLLSDGIGVVKALKILYNINVDRIPGADLMQNICREAPRKGYKIFIYGSREEVNSKACVELQKRCPGINIVGRANGFVKETEMPDLIRKINESHADILFIATGSPQQEKWMSLYCKQLTTVKICQGIGGTLDTIVGTVKRAPMFWQNLGLEWFYRLLCQPSRFRRQLRCFKFAYEVFKCKLFGVNATGNKNA